MRQSRIDVARGLLMLYIIAIVHAMYWLNIYDGPEKSFILFEMPCIFFISGYAYALSLRGGGAVLTARGYVQYVKKRVERILIPYWFYAAACVALIFVKGDPALRATGADKASTILAWANPLTFGAGHSFEMLNFHLWFIAPFLGVAFVMPWLARPVARWALPLSALLLGGFALILINSFFKLGALEKNLVTYAIWSLLGFAVASMPAGALPRRWQMIAVFLLCVVLLYLSYLFSFASMDMQQNKFPPNAVFFIFCLGWISLLVFGLSFVKDATLDRFRATTWFRPFVEKGYSIYMWQGFAYTVAEMIGNKFHFPVAVIWGSAVLLTVFLGILASPLESLRLPFGNRARALASSR